MQVIRNKYTAAFQVRYLRYLFTAIFLYLVSPSVFSAEINEIPDALKGLNKYFIKNTLPRRIAFVAGNSEYITANPLPGSIKDATEARNILKSLGFEVEQSPIFDFQTSDDFYANHFDQFLRRIKKGDFVVFYYSGHGFQYGMSTYLTPTNFPASVEEKHITKTFLAVSNIRDEILKHEPSLLVMMLDACRTIGGPVATSNISLRSGEILKQTELIFGQSGLEIKSDSGMRKKAEHGLALPHRLGKNTIMLYASEAGTASIGSNAGQLSHFTAGLVKHLAKPGLDLYYVSKSINSYVGYHTGYTQTPWLSDNSPTLVWFNPNEKTHEEYLAAFKNALNESPDSVRNYADMYALGPYAHAANQYLSDNGYRAAPNEIYTRYLARSIDNGWDGTIAKSGQSLRIAEIRGSLALTRTSKHMLASRTSRMLELSYDVSNPSAATIIPSNNYKQLSTSSSPLLAAKILSAHGESVSLSPKLKLRAAPDIEAPASASAGYMQKLLIDGYVTNPKGEVWSKVKLPGSDKSGFVLIPKQENSDFLDLKPLQEIYLESESSDSSPFIKSEYLSKKLNDIKSSGKYIRWISIATASAENPRIRAILRARASDAYRIANEAGVPRGYISIVEEAEFKGMRIRLRIFGNAVSSKLK